MPVITITGLFGAGRETIGQIVADRLDAELVDRKIFEELRRRLDLPPEEVERQEEMPASLLDRLLSALGNASVEFAAPPEAAWTPPYDDVAYDTRRAVLHLTQELVREAARTGRAVIVGRGGAHLLADRVGTLHVFLHGSEPDRLAATMRGGERKEDVARRMIRHGDANRAAYMKQVYNEDWLKPHHYHLLIDSGRFGWEQAADIIVAAAGLL